MGELTLDELLRAANLSYREVERRSGVARLTLRKMRSGVTRRPSLHVCMRLAALLGVDTVDVLAAGVESISRARARKVEA